MNHQYFLVSQKGLETYIQTIFSLILYNQEQDQNLFILIRWGQDVF